MLATRATFAVGLALSLVTLGSCIVDEQIDPPPDETSPMPPFEVAPDRSRATLREIDGRPDFRPPEIEIQELRDRARELFSDRALWTRLYVIESLENLPDRTVTAERLLRNQADLGDLLRPFYGTVRTERITERLRAHVLALGAIIDASLKRAAHERSLVHAYAVADDLAALLADANPAWLEADLRALLHEELDAIVVQITARLDRDLGDESAADDDATRLGRRLADHLSNGLAAQFPDSVTPALLPPDIFHETMRARFEDLVGRTRLYLVARTADLDDATTAEKRLFDSQRDLTLVFGDIYGADVGAKIDALLRTHLEDLVAYVDAALAGQKSDADTARAAMYANAHALAEYLVSLNDYWSLSELDQSLRTYLQRIKNMLASRLDGDWSADVEQHDEIEAHMRRFADTLSIGIEAQHTVKQF